MPLAAHPSKQEHTYAFVRERIRDGTYAPGHRLVIDAIARELGVSSIPVREAVRRLEAEGWVTYQRNQGAQVASVDVPAWAEAMGTLAVLEGYATALAAPRLEPDDLSRLRELNEEMSEAIRALDVLRVSEANQAFHSAIHERCPNRHLRGQLATIQDRLDHLRRTIFAFIPLRGRASLVEHEEIIAAIERGAKASQIERLARQHKLHTIDACLEKVDPEGRPE